jgi:hypothetical protein
MAEQPTIVKQAEDVVSKVAASVAETLNFGEKEVVGNPGKLCGPVLLNLKLTARPTNTLHRREGRLRHRGQRFPTLPLRYSFGRIPVTRPYTRI